MKIKRLHEWNLSIREAKAVQENLASKVRLSGGLGKPKVVAGADISFSKKSTSAFAGVVLLDFPALEIIGEFTLKGALEFPYVPGLLSFREGPILLELFERVHPTPDLIFFDGQGLAHPRKLGLACHMGLFLDRPAIGCGKSKLVGDYSEPGLLKGDYSSLVDKDNEKLGSVVRTKDGCKPIFVSPGHKIGFETARRRTLECSTRYRIPEPTRLAHLLVNEVRKKDADTSH